MYKYSAAFRAPNGIKTIPLWPEATAVVGRATYSVDAQLDLCVKVKGTVVGCRQGFVKDQGVSGRPLAPATSTRYMDLRVF